VLREIADSEEEEEDDGEGGGQACRIRGFSWRELLRWSFATSYFPPSWSVASRGFSFLTPLSTTCRLARWWKRRIIETGDEEKTKGPFTWTVVRVTRPRA